jgi:PAT family beta-lactamase induction signal transducer AmpG
MPSTIGMFFSRRMLAVLVLGFSSGLPLALTGTGATFQAWMTAEKVDLTTIGAFSLVGLPYTWKFVWSPLVDRYVPPFMGRRRGWIFLTQLVLLVTIAVLGLWTRNQGLEMLALLAVTVAFFSATQDIVVDAYRTEVLPTVELGPGASTYVLGYRIGMIVSGAVAMRLADHIPFRQVYLIMAACMLVGMLATRYAPEPDLAAKPPRSLEEAVTLPFYQFFQREGAVEMLVFTLLYKLDGMMISGMATPFLLSIGFTNSEVGTVTQFHGLLATIAGAVIGGALMPRLGIYVSLWVFGLFQGVSNMAYWWLATSGPSYAKLVGVVVLDNLATGMGVAAFAAFLMSLCDPRYTATQYALLTSFMAFTRVVGGAPTGFLAKALGWPLYFLLCTIVAVPGLLLLTRYRTWAKPTREDEAVAAAGSAAE